MGLLMRENRLQLMIDAWAWIPYLLLRVLYWKFNIFFMEGDSSKRSFSFPCLMRVISIPGCYFVNSYFFDEGDCVLMFQHFQVLNSMLLQIIAVLSCCKTQIVLL